MERLAKGGMNIARLNMSHGTHEWHQKVIKAIRTINEKGIYSIAILLDTRGPEIRSGDLKREIELKKGDLFTFTIRKESEYEENCTEVNYDEFVNDVKPGDVILVDGGIVSFEVKEKKEKDLVCECLDGGTMTSRRHLNIKGRSAKMPSITDKDWQDIDFGIEHGVDFIALSFIKDEKAIKELRKYLKKKKTAIEIIAKIESADSIPHLEAILEEADGAMIARGDLGAEIPLEEVPLVQDDVVTKCRKLGKPVIVATHLLESMIIHPTPTRAEVTDITKAVTQKSDGIMLSGETAAGNYPFKALEVMDRVATRIEQKLIENKKIMVAVTDEPKEEIVMSASIMANNLDSKAILVFTRRGYMATLLSRCRPNSPTYAFTNTSNVRRRLNLYWGVIPYRIDFSKDPEKTIQRAIKLLESKKILHKGDNVIIVSDILAGEEFVETIQVRQIK